jgi:nitrite reductase (cytochrome c-552)
MWAGYAFSKDFREERGHAYMLDDQTFTERQQVTKQPGTCLNCHAAMYTTYKKLGNGDLTKGFEAVNQMPYFEARKLVEHPVACIDCHDPANMQLRVTRPAFMEGLQALAASDDPVPQLASIERWRKDGRKGVYDVNTMASRQEMRAFVCGQCHVEYHFKGRRSG